MGLETATTISGLVSSNPAATDAISQGDDHLKLIKAVLKSQFPGAGGTGFSIPITATEAQLNFVTGVTSNIQTQLNALAAGDFPSGTRIPFFQNSPPTGWTLVVTHNDKMLRVVNTVGGTSGGTDSPILMNKVPSHTHVVSGTTDLAGSHAHIEYVSVGAGPSACVAGTLGTGAQSTSNVTSTEPAHTHTYTTTSQANTGASNWTPAYIDLIICNKT